VLDLTKDDRITLVAIDGVDGAGKTTFARELAEHVEAAGRPVIRASVDSFHRSRAERYARGRNSAEGFYRDSYDYELLKASLLDPLSSGSGRFRRAAFNVESDAPVDSPLEDAVPGSVLIFDGIFLQRPELRRYWHLSILLDVPWEKNHHLLNHPEWNAGQPDPNSPQHRYAEGQRIYFRECDPHGAASIVIDNTDLSNPIVIKAPKT